MDEQQKDAYTDQAEVGPELSPEVVGYQQTLTRIGAEWQRVQALDRLTKVWSGLHAAALMTPWADSAAMAALEEAELKLREAVKAVAGGIA